MSEISVEALPMSRQQIRQLARHIRVAFEIDDHLKVDVGALLEFELPKKMKGFTFDVKPISEMGDDHGFALPDMNLITLREDVYERAIYGHGRDRGTVIHELAHVLLHKSERMLHRRAVGAPVSYRDPEWQAKAFAGEFLVPAHLMEGFTSVAEVARACGVSVQCAAIQLKSYVREGLIQKGQIRDLAL